MGKWSDLLGTSKNVFKIGMLKLSIDANAPTTPRTMTVGDHDIDFTSGAVGDYLKKVSASSVAFAPATGGASSFTILTGPANMTGTYDGDVYASGAITMTANVVVRGNLIFDRTTPPTISNAGLGYNLIVLGDICGEIYDSGGPNWGANNINLFGNLGAPGSNGGSLFVGGNLKTTTTVDVSGGHSTSGNNNGGNTGFIYINGDVLSGCQLTSKSGNSFITAIGNNRTCGVANAIYIGGDFHGSIDCTGGINSHNSTVPVNTAITIKGNFYDQSGGNLIYNQAGNGNSSFNGKRAAQGGNITISGSVYGGSIYTIAGNVTTAATRGSEAGDIYIHGSLYDGTLQSIGGDNTSTVQRAGHSGNITILGEVSSPGNINAVGGNSTGYTGGTAGTIIIQGPCMIGNINNYGGNGSISGGGGSGGQLNFYSTMNCTQINSNGGGNSGSAGGILGNIVINGTILVNADALGGNAGALILNQISNAAIYCNSLNASGQISIKGNCVNTPIFSQSSSVSVEGDYLHNLGDCTLPDYLTVLGNMNVNGILLGNVCYGLTVHGNLTVAIICDFTPAVGRDGGNYTVKGDVKVGQVSFNEPYDSGVTPGQFDGNITKLNDSIFSAGGPTTIQTSTDYTGMTINEIYFTSGLNVGTWWAVASSLWNGISYDINLVSPPTFGITPGDFFDINPKQSFVSNDPFSVGFDAGFVTGVNAGASEIVSNNTTLFFPTFMQIFTLANPLLNDIDVPNASFNTRMAFRANNNNSNVFNHSTQQITFLTGPNAAATRLISSFGNTNLYQVSVAFPAMITGPDILYTIVRTSIRLRINQGAAPTIYIGGRLIADGSLTLRPLEGTANLGGCNLTVNGDITSTYSNYDLPSLVDLSSRGLGNSNGGAFHCDGDVHDFSVSTNATQNGWGNAGSIQMQDCLGLSDPLNPSVGTIVEAIGYNGLGGNITMRDFIGYAIRSHVLNDNVNPNSNCNGGRLLAKNIYAQGDVNLSGGGTSSLLFYFGRPAADTTIMGDLICGSLLADANAGNFTAGRGVVGSNGDAVTITVKGKVVSGTITMCGGGYMDSPIVVGVNPSRGNNLTCNSLQLNGSFSSVGGWGPNSLSTYNYGGNLTVYDTAFVSGTINCSGGNSGTTGDAGNGGTITFNSNADVGFISSSGGNANSTTSGAGGNGSTITAKNLKANTITTNGGNTSSTAGSSAGAGGTTNVDILIVNSYNSSGGNSQDSSNIVNGRTAGTINADNIIITNTLNMQGGNTVASSSSRTGGTGGTLTIKGDLNASGSSFNAKGGSSLGATGIGGVGGQISIGGSATSTIDLRIDGGNGAAEGGRGGLITFKGFANLTNLFANGANGTVAGSCGNFKFFSGVAMNALTALDGTGTASTVAVMQEFGGKCSIRSWSIANRATVSLAEARSKVVGMPAQVFCNTITGKVRMLKSSNLETLTSTNAMFFDGTNWNSFTNAVIA